MHYIVYFMMLCSISYHLDHGHFPKEVGGHSQPQKDIKSYRLNRSRGQFNENIGVKFFSLIWHFFYLIIKQMRHILPHIKWSKALFNIKPLFIFCLPNHETPGQDGSYLAEFLLEKGYEVRETLQYTTADRRQKTGNNRY